MIQIINGFKINSKHPVDSRIIVDDEATRLAILYKYHGLRVWQTDTNTPYFWDGTDWKSELDLVVTSDGDVTEGSVPVFTKSNPVKIGDSIISVVGGEVIINGDLSFDSISSGSIDAGRIDTGTMSVSRLQKGSDGQILSTNNSGLIEWTNLSGLTIGKSTNSDNSEKLKIKTINLSSTYQLVLRNESSDISGPGGNYIDLFSHTNGLKFKNDGGNGLRILAHNGNSSNPPYSFENSLNTGMYRIDGVENKIGFSINGNRRLWIEDTYIGFGDLIDGSPTVRTNKNTSPATPSYSWFGNPNTGMYRPANNEIGFSTSGTERVRITSSYINFGLSSTGTPIIKNNSGSVGSPSYTWYNNSNTGMYRPANNEIGFSAEGSTNLVIGNGFVTFGDNITNGSPRIRTGLNTSPTSPSYTWYGNDQTGIYRPSQDVIGFSTSGVLRLKIENDGTTVNNNFYLPRPNGSTPTAGKILTAVDESGKVEWSDSPLPLHVADYQNIVGSNVFDTWDSLRGLIDHTLKNDGKKYIINIIAKTRVAPKWAGPTTDTGLYTLSLKLNYAEVDKSYYRHMHEDKEVNSFATTLVCSYVGEITANGQSLKLDIIHDNLSYLKSYNGIKIDILYIPIT